MSRAYKISTAIGLALATFSVACRYFVPVADLYAHNVYPIISDILSWVSAPIPFNIEELTIIGIVLLAVAIIVASHIHGYLKFLKAKLYRRISPSPNNGSS